MLSINQYLLTLANETFRIKTSSSEATKIDASINHLKSTLTSYFDEAVIGVIEFGSYKRDTVLPKAVDQLRDVDLMIIFDHSNLMVNPITYRKYIQDFSDFYYPRSSSFKDKPTVVLEFNHLRYDLVPAYRDTDFFGDDLFYIPDSDTEWKKTDPYGFHDKLERKNNNNKQLIKPLIRLLKDWNAKAGYPVSSFALEQYVVSTTYYFLDTLEEYFFDAIGSLDTSYSSATTNNKIKALKENANKVQRALENGDIKQALRWLSHILPLS